LPKAAEPVVLVASSEFTLKSSPVRRTLEQRLIDDIKFALRRGNVEFSRVEKEAARLVIFGTKQPELAASVCSRIFGVAYAAYAQLLTNPTLEEITQVVAELATHHLSAGDSFAVRAHRSMPGGISRRDVELEGGAKVLSTMQGRSVTVNLDSPDVTFNVDLVGTDAFLYTRKKKGPGGLPLSSDWRMLAVLDRGSLSILAASAMMRRGCVVELFIPVSSSIAGWASRTQMALAEKLARLVTRPNYKAFVFEIDGFVVRKDAPPVSRSLIRAMAVKFAREKRFRGVILSDISGHLASLNQTHSNSEQVPIFYPLLGFDHADIEELAKFADIEETELTAQSRFENQLPDFESRRVLFESIEVPSIREVHF